MKRTLAEYARACGGELHGADRAYSGVSTDTRTLKPEEVEKLLQDQLAQK